MEIEKKRELGLQRLILSFDGKSGENRLTGGERPQTDFREQMMLENEIPGHIPFVIRRINGRKTYEYDIEGLSSLEEEAERKLGFETIKVMARGLSDIVEAGEAYLLKEEDYVVEPGTIFFDKKKKELKMVYCPGFGQDLKTRLAGLMEYCLDTIDYNDASAVQSAYGLYMKLRDGCSLRQIKELVDGFGDTFAENSEEKDCEKIHTCIEQEIKADSPAPAESECEDGGRVLSNPSKYPDDGPEYLKEKRNPFRWVADFWYYAERQVRVTVVACTGVYVALVIAVFSGRIEKLSQKAAGIPLWFPILIAATVIYITLMIRSVRPVCKLLSDRGRLEEEDDNETILMIGNGTQDSLMLVSDGMPGLCTDKFPCVIGKDKASCDLVVEAGGVSRQHLRFNRNYDGGFTVEDLNTINGTFINGHKLAPNMSFAIREGDEISFGSVSYYVNHLG
ncbi:MAG: FHA domain-containing protein [Lachnospiraceae bacterium]|nr:FHA domain-containing protein [Lachnospiraceae bacterium]